MHLYTLIIFKSNIKILHSLIYYLVFVILCLFIKHCLIIIPIYNNLIKQL